MITPYEYLNYYLKVAFDIDHQKVLHALKRPFLWESPKELNQSLKQTI